MLMLMLGGPIVETITYDSTKGLFDKNSFISELRGGYSDSIKRISRK